MVPTEYIKVPIISPNCILTLYKIDHLQKVPIDFTGKTSLGR